jgi:hypothetical protein
VSTIASYNRHSYNARGVRSRKSSRKESSSATSKPTADLIRQA